jgi:hypothetical protein
MLISGKPRKIPETKLDRLALGIVLLSLVTAGELALIGCFAMVPWVIAGWLRGRLE